MRIETRKHTLLSMLITRFILCGLAYAGMIAAILPRDSWLSFSTITTGAIALSFAGLVMRRELRQPHRKVQSRIREGSFSFVSYGIGGMVIIGWAVTHWSHLGDAVALLLLGLASVTTLHFVLIQPPRNFKGADLEAPESTQATTPDILKALARKSVFLVVSAALIGGVLSILLGRWALFAPVFFYLCALGVPTVLYPAFQEVEGASSH